MMNESKVTEQDVISFYKIFLGRSPENLDVVSRHIDGGATRAEFLDKILKSDEFYRCNFRAFSRYILSGAPVAESRRIQVECKSEQLDKLFAHIQSVWSRLGEEQPHYSVLSTRQFSPDAISHNLDAFHYSGRHEIETIIKRLSGLNLQINIEGQAIELGCGVGRVTRHIASHVRQTIGYDISQSHLSIAQDYVKEQGVTNVGFAHLDQIAEIDFAPHDFFYSRIVLQHNPPPVMNYLLDKIFARTLPAGIVVFQLPTAIRNYTFDVADYLAVCGSITGMELHCLPQAHVFKTMIKNGIMPLDVHRDGSLTGFENVSMTFIGQKLPD